MTNMKKILISLLFLPAFLLVTGGCGGNKQANNEADTDSTNVPDFIADSAFSSIMTQCAFGPRVMNSDAHEKCGKYIMDKFQSYGLRVIQQKSDFTRYDGLKMPGYNIIAQYNPKANTRLLFATHWDSRPWADHDADVAKQKSPVLAANDGASGVAVLIEMARLISGGNLPFGVDFVCFDAEDAGVPEWEKEIKDDDKFWCLGSQYWALHPHAAGIKFGVLLDMVGGRGASFYREGFSERYASDVIDRVWQASKNAGYASFFRDETGGFITDDHLPVNRTARIPMADIVPYYPTADSGFGPTWHTTQDTPENIDRNTLKAVGQTLLQLIYTYKE